MARLRKQRSALKSALIGKFDAKLMKVLHTQKWRYRTASRSRSLVQQDRKFSLAAVGSHSCALYKCGKFQFLLRSGSTDDNCLAELFTRNVYGRSLKSGQVWLDLGGHRGLFALRAIMEGAREVFSYEPHPGNFTFLHLNTDGLPVRRYQVACTEVESSSGRRSATLYVCKNPENTWRHTTMPVQQRHRLSVRAMDFGRILKRHGNVSAVKLDIEGAELSILETASFPQRVKWLVFEYSFSVDPDVARFKRIIARLKSVFSTVHFPPSALRRPRVSGPGTGFVKYRHRDIIVHCSRP